MKRRCVKVGKIFIGGGNPISIQTMTKIPTSNVKRVINQIRNIEKAGGEIVRVSVLNKKDALAISKIKKEVQVPLVADIHYDYRLGLYAIESGVDKLRINPSNLKKEGIKTIIKAARDKNIPVRLGLNSGSVKIKSGNIVKDIVDATMETIKFCEDNGFFDIVVSLKTPYVKTTIEAYREIFDRCNYPLHLGVTEAGYGDTGVAKSILGIGILLFEGIGDTIRVSLTDTPEREVRIAQAILQALELRKFEPEIISCPVCGRCQVPVKKIARKIKNGIMDMMVDNSFLKNLTIAIMGCSVNGPGEAKQADIGIAGGKDRFTLFAKGNIIGTYPTKVIEKIFFEKIKEISNG